MHRNTRILLLVALASSLAPMVASAKSSDVTGTTPPPTATARLDVQITVPKVLFLRVGTGADFPTNATIHQVAFTVPAASVGNGTAAAATAAPGDIGNGPVTAKVTGHNGNIALTSSTLGKLGSSM